MTEIVGYLTHRGDHDEGIPGIGYDYILAGNGIYIRANNKYLGAVIPVANCQIRGLKPLEANVSLYNGKIPGVLFELAFNTALARKDKEVYFAITWQDKYHLFMTGQDGNPGHVKYQTLDQTIMGLHSHPTFPAYFSGDDNRDEQGLRLDAVIGRLDRTPEVLVRVGVYGYFLPVPWDLVFEGTLIGVHDAIKDREEVTSLELSAGCEIREGDISRSWWHRFLSR